MYLSRNTKSKILSSYVSSIPVTISNKTLTVPPALESFLSDLIANISRFDAIQSQKGYGFPNLLLRSESAASSQIENLTSSIRNITLAEIDQKSPKNARLFAGNVFAMRKALSLDEPFSTSLIAKIHTELLGKEESFAGQFRTQPAWIGGTSYSPHGAIFVPPHDSLIHFYLDDLVEYAKRIDINPIVKAAIIHAQFETIHPFIDGNGRTGRTLLHKSLKDDGILQAIALPISAGLLHDTKTISRQFLLSKKEIPFL